VLAIVLSYNIELNFDWFIALFIDEIGREIYYNLKARD